MTSSSAAWWHATSHRPPATLLILPAWEPGRNCLLQASCDFAALGCNAPACLSQRKIPAKFSHSSHGNHHGRCSSGLAPHPPWAAQPVGSGHHRALCFSPHLQEFLTHPRPGSPSPRAYCSFLLPLLPLGLNTQPPQTGGEGAPHLAPIAWAVSVQQAECKDATFSWEHLCCASLSGCGEGGWGGCYLQGSRCPPKLPRARQTRGPIKSPLLLSSRSAKPPPEHHRCTTHHWRNFCLATAPSCRRSRGIPLSLSLPRNCPGTPGTACSLLADWEHLPFPRLPWKTPHQHRAKRHPGDSDPTWSTPTGEGQQGGVGHARRSLLPPGPRWPGDIVLPGECPLDQTSN